MIRTNYTKTMRGCHAMVIRNAITPRREMPLARGLHKRYAILETKSPSIMKRRQFLKASAFAAASTMILPRTRLFGADAPSNKLHIALLGTWGRGEAHFENISSENVVAICDVNEEHLASGAKKFPGAKQYVDWRKAIDQKDVDAVVCCTADHTHAFVANWT